MWIRIGYNICFINIFFYSLSVIKDIVFFIQKFIEICYEEIEKREKFNKVVV